MHMMCVVFEQNKCCPLPKFLVLSLRRIYVRRRVPKDNHYPCLATEWQCFWLPCLLHYSTRNLTVDLFHFLRLLPSIPLWRTHSRAPLHQRNDIQPPSPPPPTRQPSPEHKIEQQATSMLTFEGTQVQGSEAIVAKYKSVGPVKHTVKSMDVQPSNNPNAILIFVTGSVQIGAEGNPLHFCEMFQLVSTGPGAYYVHNDVFRLNYGL